ncbi:MAG: hypothetical protein QM758_24565 [Armatimonas sp.]
MEAAITARLERVVQEVIEVRRRAQTLSEELESVRAERGVLLATLEEERTALAAARVALEVERTKSQEHKPLTPPESVPVPVLEEEPLTPIEPEVVPELVSVVTEAPAPRLPSPRKLLGKLKFGRNKGKAEEPGTPELTIVTTLEEELHAKPEETLEAVEAEAAVEVITFAPVTPLEVDLPAPEPAAVLDLKPKSTAKSRVAKPKRGTPPTRFAPREFLASLPGLDDDQLDLAAFGIAQLDDDGGIVALNQQGATLLSIDKNEALDQVLFGAILPDPDAAARFVAGAVVGKLDVVLLVERDLTVHLFRHAKSRTNWALLRKQEGVEA